MDFNNLINTIRSVHCRLSQLAVRKTDQFMTARNWLIEFYIVEFEQHGEDRSVYGQNPIPEISISMKKQGIKGFSERNIYLFKNFYITYPDILQTLSTKLPLLDLQIHFNKVKKVLPKNEDLPSLDFDLLLDRLCFSHFAELITINDPLKHCFYEIEAIKNNWTVRDLNRAINTSVFERTGLSTDKQSIIDRISETHTTNITDIIRDPYLLEFLQLQEKAEYSETDLESAITTHLQEFLLELGNGFCFESRQKRISFNNRHYRIDLVFYHRVLKCHILIDLKIGEFDHADAGQMNVYLNYYRKNEMVKGDNPPVGIILCAGKDNTLVEYATNGLENDLFVSQYLVELPDKEQLRSFIKRESQSLRQYEHKEK